MKPNTQTFHQIWLGSKPIPTALNRFCQTWHTFHPNWVFQLWDEPTSIALIKEKYPNFLTLYESIPYAIQRVDIIKYLVLSAFGGVYIDCDYECLKPINMLLSHPVCLGLEPRDEVLHKEFPFFIGSAFMAAEPRSAFFKDTIARCEAQLRLFTPRWQEMSKYQYVMETTGPTLINRVYHDFENKDSIGLLPPEIIGPFRGREATLYRENKKLGYGADKVANAYAIHHFMGSWL
jgi:inositol phosphorylceramide mannosyltransferase catalytic subunit